MVSAYDYYDAVNNDANFDSWGALAAGIKTLRTAQTALESRRADLHDHTLNTRVQTIQPMLAEIDALIDHIKTRSNPALADAVAQAMIETIDAERELPELTPQEAVKMLITIMNEDSETVKDCTVGATVAYATTNVGDFRVIVGTDNLDGDDLQNARAEQMPVICVEDAQGPARGGIQSGRERFLLKGEKTRPNFHQNWPKGSGIKTRMRCVCGSEDQAAGPGYNMIVNGDMEDATAGVPEHWVRDVGTSVTLSNATTAPLRGSSHGVLTGATTVVLTKLHQKLDSTRGVSLEGRQMYCVHIPLRGGVMPTQGVVRISFQTSTGGILNGGACTLSITATTLSTSTWTSHGAMMAAPADIPATTRVVVELTTALASGESVYFDDVTVQKATQPHQSSPYFSVVAMGTDAVIGDKATITITNTRAADEWVTELDRILDIYSMKNDLGEGLFIPTAASGAETIPDSIIA